MMKKASNWHEAYADASSTPWTPEAWRDFCEDGPDVDAQRKYHLSREPHLALKHLQLSPKDSLLEAGSGYGRITTHLLETGATVTGSDISPKMVEFCKRRFNNSLSFSIDQCDIAKLPFPDQTFDKVLCSGVLMHVDDYEKIVAELVRVLRSGGRLVVSINSSFCFFYQLGKLQTSFIKLVRKLAGKGPNPNAVNCKPHSPIRVMNFLEAQSLKLLDVEASTLFCGDYRIAKFGVPILPTFGLSLYKWLDRVFGNKLPASLFGWEVWFVAQKSK